VIGRGGNIIHLLQGLTERVIRAAVSWTDRQTDSKAKQQLGCMRELSGKK
jgi:hypothetical protein